MHAAARVDCSKPKSGYAESAVFVSELLAIARPCLFTHRRIVYSSVVTSRTVVRAEDGLVVNQACVRGFVRGPGAESRDAAVCLPPTDRRAKTNLIQMAKCARRRKRKFSVPHPPPSLSLDASQTCPIFPFLFCAKPLAKTRKTRSEILIQNCVAGCFRGAESHAASYASIIDRRIRGQHHVRLVSALRGLPHQPGLHGRRV